MVTGSQTSFSANPDDGVPLMLGRTGTAGKIAYRTGFDTRDAGDNDRQSFVSVLSVGPIAAIEGQTVDQVPVSYTATGAAIGQYSGWMWSQTQLGALPEGSPLGFGAGAGTPPGWGPTHKLSGKAAASWTLRFDTKGKMFQAGVPAPMWVGRGARCYDPTKDSTYPGGSGPHRMADPSDTAAYDAAQATWEWTEDPYLLGLRWAHGVWQRDPSVAGSTYQRVMGIGAPWALIDVAAFVEGRNIAVANGWKAGGIVYSTDGKWDTMKRILQAGMGEPMALGARISCYVNAPKVSLATITTDDVVGAASVTATQSRRDRINTITPRYRLEANNWQYLPGSPINVPEHVALDGGKRSRLQDYPLIQDTRQVATAVRYDIENAREFGPITLPLKLVWMGYKPGDCVTATLPELGLNAQPILLLQRQLAPASGVVTMTARSETPGKHAFALGQTTTPPPTPGVTAQPIVPMPRDGDWTLAALPAGGQLVTPTLAISGACAANVDGVVFEYRVFDSGAVWTAAGSDAPTATYREITGLRAGTAYEVAVSYTKAGVASDRRVIGPVTTANIVIGMTAAERAALAEAQARIAALASDAVLSAGSEKLQAIIDFDAIKADRDSLDARYVEIGAPADITPSRDAAVLSVSYLQDYLVSLGPIGWADQSGDTEIVAATWQAKWSAALNALAEFRAAITGRKGDPGAGAVTLVAGSATTIVDRNSVSASAVNNDDQWGTDAAYSREAYTGGAVCTFTLPAPNGEYIMAGLTQGDPGSNPGNSFNSITFALYRSPSNTFGVYINGDEQSGTTPYTSAAAAKCRVQFDGRYVRWYADSTLIYVFDWMGTTADPNAPANALRFRTALAGDARVEDITLSAAGAAGSDGQDGAPGYNNAAVTIYRRSASEPTRPTATVTYTFAGASVSGLNNGWTTSIPAGDDPVWASGAGVSSQGATDTIAPNEWAEPVQVFADGANGISAPNNKVVFIYRISEAAPALPSADTTYTFSSKALSGLTNGWSATIPDGSGTRWVSTASALSASDTDTIAPGEWAAVAKLAQDGAPGISPLLVTAQPAALQLQGDTTGAAVPGSLPAYIENGAARGGVPATITDVTIDAASGCTASVADDGTTIAITAISKATASVSYTVSAAGLSQQVKVGITVLRAPTSLEERGLNIGSGGTSTSYDVFGGTISIQAGSSGKIDTQLTGTYYSGGSGAIGTTRLVTKHQYRLPGGSWVDASGTEGAGSDATRANGGPGEPPENSPGSPYGAIGHITGLTAGTYYEVRALAYYDAGVASAKPATGVGCVLIAKQVA